MADLHFVGGEKGGVGKSLEFYDTQVRHIIVRNWGRAGRAQSPAQTPVREPDGGTGKPSTKTSKTAHRKRSR